MLRTWAPIYRRRAGRGKPRAESSVAGLRFHLGFGTLFSMKTSTPVFRCRFLLLCLALSVAALRPCRAESPGQLLVIFDASGSMQESLGAETKLAAAKRVLNKLLPTLPQDSAVGLMVFGHRSSECTDIQLVEPIQPLTPATVARMQETVNRLAARGWTPIAGSLRQSLSAFGGKPGRIVLVTDGEESCQGDVCAAALELKNSGIDLVVDIVGFGLNAAQQASLKCITETTGGRYYDARDGEALGKAMGEAAQSALSRTRLQVTVTEGEQGLARQPLITVRNLDDPAQGPVSQMENPSVFALAAGKYGVVAKVGTGAETRPVEVVVEENKTTELAINTGTGTLEIRLAAGGTPLSGPMIQLMQDGRLVAAESQSPARFQAQAGTYAVRVDFSGIQSYEVTNVLVKAGETVAQAIDVPCARLTVEVSGGERYPYVAVLQNGRMLTALSDNPARFRLLAGAYAVGVQVQGEMKGLTDVVVESGRDQTIQIRLAAP